MKTDAIDTLEELGHARRSVRAFLPEPVPEALIRRALTIAQQAPSNCNIQPWMIHIVSGAAAKRMRTALHDAAASGQRPTPDYPFTGPYPGLYRTRQIDAAKTLFKATGVAREDMEGRRQSLLRNYLFFDAPHVAFLFMPDAFGLREAGDCGIFTQTLLLALTALGIGSCAQGALSHHAEVVRRELGIDASQRLLLGIAFGWEDRDHPANAARVGRADIDETATFYE